jgi:Helicase HerA, central domain/TraM recognition site of TraD and TraG
MLRHLLLSPPGFTRQFLRRALHDLAAAGLRAVPALVLLAGAVLAARELITRHRHARLAAGARQVTILAPPAASPEGGRVLWANLTGLLRPPWRRLLSGQPHLAFEYAWSQAGAQITLWLPAAIPPGLAERAAEAAWPGALTRAGPAAPPVPAGSAAEAGVLRLARPDHYPIRSEHDADPLRAVFAAAEGLGEGETALLQVLARPVAGPRLLHARRAAARLAGGGPARPASALLDLITPGIARTARRPAASGSFPDKPAEIRAILGKAAGPRWAVAVRYAVTSPAGPSPAARARLRGRAHALASAAALYTSGHNYLARRPLRRPAPALASRRLGRGQLLSVPELAALAHLPTDPAVPGLARAGANAVAPPPAIPVPGPGTRPLGEADAGIPRLVAVSAADARHHLHVLGETGAGKSTLIASMVLADAQAGRGALVIDPKGDLVADLLGRLPGHAGARTVLFDPADPGPPPSLNVLGGRDSDLTVDHLVGIFRKIFVEFWGPRTDDVLRAACLTLAARPAATLADIPRLLGDTAYRQRATAGIREPILKGFWDWYESLSDAHRGFITAPLQNKMRAFLLRRFVRETVGTATSSFDMSDVLDGGLCLVRLPKGVLGEDTTRLLGSVILARAWQAATQRARAGHSARKDACLYIDECHNFLSLPHGMEDMLAEARAYAVSLCLVHQNLAQLGRELREGISANARNKVIFTVSPEDARVLERHVQPVLSAHDLAHLGAFQAAARLVAGAAEQPAFTMRTLPLPPPVPGRAEAIRAAARAYAGSRSRPGTAAPRLTTADPRLAPGGTP